MAKIRLDGGDWQFKGYIGEDWLFRNAHKPVTRDTRGWRAASVPGSVQHDLWSAGLIPDPYFEMNSLAAEWVPQRTWLYRKTFTLDSHARGQRTRLVFQGVDYAARYFLNGEALGESKGTFLPVAFEVGDLLNRAGENTLAVVIDPAPFEQPQIGYTSRVYTQKPRMNYWWDFCPRMVHLGIWQEVYLEETGAARIAEATIRPNLSADLLRAEVEVTLELDKPAEVEANLEVILRRAGQAEAMQSELVNMPAGAHVGAVIFRLDQPDLWWPNGAGEQPLYEVEVRVLVENDLSDTRRETFGIRRIAFETNDGAGEGTLPYNLVVNGRKLFIQGWNWVPMDVLYGTSQQEKRERLLRLAQNANVNLLRVWGGGLIETEPFYDLCDRLGILVWQEFIQSSSGIDNVPSEDPGFIQFLVQNAETAIRGRRNHPSLAVWCGGNELHYSQTKLCDDSHPALAALRETVTRLDAERQWFPTSPAGGVFSFKAAETEEEARLLQDVHGPWEYQGLRKQYALYNQGRSLLHSEFGVEGLTNLRALNQTIASEHQWPVSLNNPVWEHLGAWWVKEKVWQEVFGGPFADVESAQRGTQFLQADGLRYAVEADRRRMHANGGTMPWQFNEPYPMAACTSAVDYFAEPKPVYYTVARAYQPLALSARFETLAWGDAQDFQAEVWAANAGEAREGTLSARLVTLDGRALHEERWQGEIGENCAQALLTVRLPIDGIPAPLFFMDINFAANGANTAASAARYLFTNGNDLAPMLEALPQASLAADITRTEQGAAIHLENTGGQAALWVWLEAEKADYRESSYTYFSDNYFCLLPGERRTITCTSAGGEERQPAITIRGWNFPPAKI